MVETDNKKPFIITIVILVLLVLALGSFIVFDKFVLNKQEEEKLTTIQDVEINLNAMYQISDTLNRLDSAFNDTHSAYLGYIYTDKELSVKKFDPAAALFVAMKDDMIDTNTNQLLPNAQIKKNFESIFGDSLVYTPSSIDAGDFYKVMYDPNNKVYAYTLAPTKQNYAPGYITYNVKTLLEKDQVNVTRKVFYVEYIENNTKANIYKHANKAQLIGTLKLRNGILDLKELTGKYASKMHTYRYVFKQNSADDYSLSSIIKEK